MTELKQKILDKGITIESIIKATGIHRNKFYSGLKYPGLFTAIELKKISKATGIKMEGVV